LRQLTEFWDFKPSWQNSIDSISAIPEAFLYSIIRFDNNIVGYGIIDKKTGDIPQIAVNKDYKGEGIARSMDCYYIDVATGLTDYKRGIQGES